MFPLRRRKAVSIVLGCISAILAACASAGRNSTPPSAAPQVPTAAASPALKWDGSPDSYFESIVSPVVGHRGMVVSEDRDASDWGAEILRQGGSAIDAAVAVGFTLAVTRPQFASIGGGGFLLYCPAPGPNGPRACHALDYREKAPSEATRDMYLRGGKADTALSQAGALASGVPGVTAGLLKALEKWGKLSRQKLLTRPILLARMGTRFTGYEEGAAYDRWKEMNRAAKTIFGCTRELDRPCAAGALIQQPDLARVLEEISKRGANGFYQGWVARKITRAIQKAGGVMSLKDLATYQPKLRHPITAHYHGLEVESMPPPSSGGVLLAQMLEYAERAEKQGYLAEGPESTLTIHALTHAMALAFADRVRYFGDPDFVSVPTKSLTADSYLDRRWSTFNPLAAALPEGAGELERPEPMHTTHFSVIDKEGNAVSVTTTINGDYGSAFVPPGTGVVMNNEMDDFSAQPGVPNQFGLVGAEANAIAPGKRPLSTMTPTVLRDARGMPRIVIGAMGGPRILTAVYLALVNRLQFGMALPDAVMAPRFHEQWRPAILDMERFRFAREVTDKLSRMGYELDQSAFFGKIHALERFENGRVWGVADPRGEGAAVAQ